MVAVLFLQSKFSRHFGTCLIKYPITVSQQKLFSVITVFLGVCGMVIKIIFIEPLFPQDQIYIIACSTVNLLFVKYGMVPVPVYILLGMPIRSLTKVYLVVVFMAFPLLIQCVAYLSAIRALKATTELHLPSSLQNTILSLQVRERKRLVRMLIVLMLAFQVCYLTRGVIMLMQEFIPLSINLSVNIKRPKRTRKTHLWSEKKFVTKIEKFRVTRTWELCI